jgi:hypothetical protein
VSAGEAREPARPVTYDDAQAGYRGTAGARERFDELTVRDLTVRAEVTLRARGKYDPGKYGPAGRYEPLTVTERLEVIATGEVLARYYRHPARVHDAVQAGASWQQIAAATGATEDHARQAYREWSDGQHMLWQHYEGRFGMDDAQHATAMRRAGEPDRDAGQ